MHLAYPCVIEVQDPFGQNKGDNINRMITITDEIYLILKYLK